MKNTFKLILVSFLVGTIILSCDKKEGTEKTNYVKIGNNEFKLVDGSLENYGPDTDTADGWEYNGYNLDLILISDGLTISNSDGELSISGKGNAVYFELIVSAADQLVPGEYVFNDNYSDLPTGCFDYSEYYLNVDSSDEGSENDTEITSGKIVVNKSGDIYTITIDCKDEKGNTVSGNYKGTLNYFNYDDDTKSARAKFGRR